MTGPTTETELLDWTAGLLARLGEGTFLPASYFAPLDLEEVLYARADEAFVEAWGRAFREVERRWPEAEVSPELRERAEAIRNEAFRRIAEGTEGHDVASFVADDLDLIVRARLLGLDDPFLADLWAVYERGEIPVPATSPTPSTPAISALRGPTPGASLVHCIVLLPKAPADLAPFFAAFERLVPGIEAERPLTPPGLLPRALAFHAGPWEWHLRIDPLRIPTKIAFALARRGSLAEVLSSYRASVRISLTQGPEERPPLAAMEQLCAAAWAWLGAGGTAVVWPEGQSFRTQDELAGIDPLRLDLHGVGLLVAWGPVGRGIAGERWFRTWGLAQFGLPDLACAVPNAANAANAAGDRDDEAAAVDLLFRYLVPHVVLELGRPLPLGMTTQIAHRLWHVVGPEGLGPLPFRPAANGIQLLERVDDAAGVS